MRPHPDKIQTRISMSGSVSTFRNPLIYQDLPKHMLLGTRQIQTFPDKARQGAVA